ncbi:RNA polymerase sigma factor [Aminipila sp.]|uniref:RNA polymerase sigma factor n=1 Tax=Aminipila sp. TaxID=2060095 RepID=UPI0028963DAA|nr:RNA polymerase sigma factor [Aminipila sp.]
MEDNSAELVIRLQKGDKAAFDRIFKLYKVKAVRTAYLLTNNKALAEDITQEAFVQCYLKIRNLKNPMQFKTWFFKSLTRIAWRMSAKEKTVVPVENIFELADYKDTEQIELDFINKENAEKIMSAVNRLEEKQKTTVLLYYYNEFSVSEIASIMGCFEGTVKSRLHTARKNLKKSLQIQETGTGEGVTDAVIYKV